MGSHAVASGSKPGTVCRANQRGSLTMMFSRRAFVGSIPLLLAETKARAESSGAADSAEWPARPVRFIVPAAAGSAGDDVCRLIAAKLGEKFGQPFAIVNQPAAVGTLAMQDLARATPDGYTIGQISATTQVIAKLYTPDLSYDGIKDFALISLLGTSPYVLATYPGIPAKTVAELVALAKAKPQPLSNAAFGTMSLGYLGSKLFERQAGITLNQIPYRSSAQAVTDVVAGRVDMQFSTLPPAVPLIRAGKLRAIATTGAQRFATLAEIPTLGGIRISGIRRRTVARNGRAGRHANEHHHNAQQRIGRSPEHHGHAGCNAAAKLRRRVLLA